MTGAALEEALASQDVERRRVAVTQIASMRGEGPGALLLQALGDPDWRVRKEAVGVAQVHAERLAVVPGLIDAICQGENVGLRNAALSVLEQLGARAADALLEAMGRVAPAARRFVVEALTCGGGPRVTEALIATADARDLNLAAAAIEVLASLGGASAESTLRRHLQNPEPFLRIAALEGLNHLRAVVSWVELQPLLLDPVARRVAVPTLGRCGDPAAVAPLFESLRMRSIHNAAAAVCALAELSQHDERVHACVEQHALELDESVRARLRALADAGELPVRQAAVSLLCYARDPESLAAAVGLAESDALSAPSLQALLAWGRPAAVALLDMMHGRDGSFRGAALELACDMAATFPSDAVEATGSASSLGQVIRQLLRRCVQDPDRTVALAAVRCLADWAAADDAALLVTTVTTTTSEDVRAAAGQALLALAQRASEAVQQAVEGVPLDGPGGAAVTPVVAALGGASAFPRLQSALGSPVAATRCVVIEALAELGGSAAAELISFAMADDSVGVQTTAARALGRVRDAEGRAIGVDSLRLALRSHDAAVQAAAAWALGESGDPAAIDALRQLAPQASSEVLWSVVSALRTLGDPRLDSFLTHPDSEVVKQVLLAISEVHGSAASHHVLTNLAHLAWDVRQLAARLAAGMPSPQVYSALQQRLQVEQDPLVRTALAQAVSSIEGAG